MNGYGSTGRHSSASKSITIQSDGEMPKTIRNNQLPTNIAMRPAVGRLGVHAGYMLLEFRLGGEQ